MLGYLECSEASLASQIRPAFLKTNEIWQNQSNLGNIIIRVEGFIVSYLGGS